MSIIEVLTINEYFSMKPSNIFDSNKSSLRTIKIILSSALLFFISWNENVIPSQISKKPRTGESVDTTKSFITRAIEKSGPSVVTIDTQRIVRTRGYSKDSRILIDPYIERFFGLRMPYETEPRIEQGQGSGFIFAEGLVITNAHVVNKSEKLIIGLTDGRKFTGKVIGQDLFTDLAVIKLNGEGPWPKAILGNSDNIKVGDWAIAVGNPYGLENTVTLGIISNLNRNVSQLGIYDKKIDLIQTDAAINPGNSGGPLLNDIGEVIGINTLIRSGPGAGLSFAIPINKAKFIANELLNNGKVIHPMIGVSLINQISNNKTLVKVQFIVPNSPADRSGILPNDIILKIDQKTIKKSSDVVNAISNIGTKKFARILIKRENKLINIRIKPIDIRELSKY